MKARLKTLLNQTFALGTFSGIDSMVAGGFKETLDLRIKTFLDETLQEVKDCLIYDNFSDGKGDEEKEIIWKHNEHLERLLEERVIKK